MEPRYQEGYTKGVHDSDAAKILKALLDLHKNIDLLIYNNEVRALARLYWNYLADEQTKQLLEVRLKQLSKINMYFDSVPNLDNYIPHIVHKFQEAYNDITFFNNQYIPVAAEYLCKEIMKGEDFAVSLEAKKIYDEFMSYLRDKDAIDEFQLSLKNSQEDIEGLFYLVKEWVNAYWMDVVDDNRVFKDLNKEELAAIFDEVIVLLIEDSSNLGRVINIATKITVTGLVESHRIITQGEYVLSYTQFMQKLNYYSTVVVNDYIKFQTIKKELIAQFKKELHLDDFKPRVLTSFVRNKLIDKVYLPLIGDNLAKQMGVVGENKRTDLMGMLLLVSPPGYGKTTLIEYIASRLGITLVKINGPSLGNDVTSLDPEKANNTGAKD